MDSIGSGRYVFTLQELDWNLNANTYSGWFVLIILEMDWYLHAEHRLRLELDWNLNANTYSGWFVLIILEMDWYLHAEHRLRLELDWNLNANTYSGWFVLIILEMDWYLHAEQSLWPDKCSRTRTDVHKVKRKWVDLKRATKAKERKLKKEVGQTGGEPAPDKLTPLEEKGVTADGDVFADNLKEPAIEEEFKIVEVEVSCTHNENKMLSNDASIAES
ncbi:hypothetical protein DPMN_001343 [Dreissena polymorpha]|uniref:Uncharacterized protein n=1 Tax=Dreissena polymorpha TaxID=45954 RepID=A0A9D4MHK6_DREPO|nr:hypothetical protein DPMN_001343 [Dreissena polymorpha]